MDSEIATLEAKLAAILNHLPQPEYNVNSVEELQVDIFNKISSGYQISQETAPILNYLLEMNRLGFITFESQPAESKPLCSDIIWKKRAYVNGLFPRQSVSYLASRLITANPNIIISETLLNRPPKKDQLQLYNFKDTDSKKTEGIEHGDRENSIYGLYPMAESHENGTIGYIDGYSGNITEPVIREDYMEDFNQNLIRDIYTKQMSLIQIWSRNITDNIFPLILSVL